MGPIFRITSVHTGIPKLCSFTALGKSSLSQELHKYLLLFCETQM